MRSSTLLILCLLYGCAIAIAQPIPSPATSSDSIDNKTGPYIRGIEIYGNVTTRPEILRSYFAFDTGEVLDTSKLRVTRSKLLATQLYEKVNIFPHLREDGAHIFLILKESVRLDLGYGIEYSTRKYGEKEIWYSAQIDATVNNFRGRMETFWFGVSAWERLGFDLSWYKPFLPTPYYATLSAGVADYPDDALPLDYTDVYGKLAFGRKVLANSRVFASVAPIYRVRNIVWEDVSDSGAGGDQPSDSEPIETSSSGINNKGLAEVAFPDRNKFFEAFAAVGFAVDRRSARFDPKSGWLLNTQIATNRLYNGVNNRFFQSTSELRYYVPLSDDVAAFRLLLTLRDIDAGIYHRLTYGGAGEILGYANKSLGWDFSAQSSILASVKYYKPLYATPELPVPLVSTLFSGVHNLTFRIDASFIADAAMLYREPQGALTQRGQTQGGLSFGFGTRILAPRIRQSGCIDLVFGRTETEDGGYEWEPALHLYLDLFY
ncbi:MAG: BamA/TamA family outer membrane protein [Chitinispirillales bacterium]|nr:BamA/TamA family outer membrane protein [Chitinispirillales bacterium]